jgi:hypothetical protein
MSTQESSEESCIENEELDLQHQKSICFICTPQIHPALGELCDSCKNDGWFCVYDYYMGKVNCVKRINKIEI